MERKGIIVYRGNDLLDGAVPVIQDSLKQKGYSVDIQRFIPETQEEQIREWATKNKGYLEQLQLKIADNTFVRSTGSNWGYDGRIFGDKDLIESSNIQLSLDKILDRVTFIQLLGEKHQHLQNFEQDKYSNLERGLKETEEAYLTLLSRIHSLPEIVYIKTDKLSHHIPFDGLRTLEDPYYADEVADKKAGELLSEWFKKAGIRETTFYPKRDALGVGAWVIHDRHKEINDRMYEWQIVLATPFANFWMDAREKGLIQNEDIDIRETLRDYISKNFK